MNVRKRLHANAKNANAKTHGEVTSVAAVEACYTSRSMIHALVCVALIHVHYELIIELFFHVELVNLRGHKLAEVAGYLTYLRHMSHNFGFSL
jgi:hypothetical protein